MSPMLSKKDLTNIDTKNSNTSVIENDLQEITKETTLERSYKQLYEDENLEKITELDKYEIADLAIIKTYAQKFKFKELENLVDNFCRYRVSLNRKGREEHVRIASANILRDDERFNKMMELEKMKGKG